MPTSISESETSSRERPADHNRDVEQALMEYCHFPRPQGFAVMLSGRWGSGKTTFIESILDDLPPPDRAGKDKPLYVSLYGIKTPSEIGDLLFQQLHPFLSHKATRLVGAVLGGAARASIKVDIGHTAQMTGVLPSVDLSSILSGSQGRIVVFDDFERASMSPAEILGYINPMVEHDERKVLVVADESQIKQKDEYVRRKEKTIGLTLEYKADAGAAYDAFMELVEDEGARTFLTASKATVLQVFTDSCLDNLRLLKYFLWDFERLWKVLTPAQRAHEGAMHGLLGLLCASSIELRTGGLTPETFKPNDYSFYFSLHSNKNDERAAAAAAIQAVYDKYRTVRFDSMLLEPAVIVDLVLRSKLEADRIQRQISQHPYFVESNKIPSWRALWRSYEARTSEHDNIVKRFEADFAARTFRSQGEINHIIGLGLWLSAMGFPGWEESKILAKLEAYIFDVYKEREADLSDVSDSPLNDDESAFGLGYMNKQNPRFRELVLQERDAWRRRAYPAIAARLRHLMTEDSEEFLREVCFTGGGSARFARLGVLKEIPADQFAETIVKSPYNDQKNVTTALSIRFEQVAAEPELQAEVPWLLEVQQHLRRLNNGLPRIARSHLSNLLGHYVDDTVVKVEDRLRRHQSNEFLQSEDAKR